MKKTKNIIWIIALILVILLIIGLGYGYYKNITMEVKNPLVTMEIENFGIVKMELYPELAPQTVSNFIGLINNGFYNNSNFYRIVKDFMIQGGKKDGNSSGKVTVGNIKGNEDKTEYTIKGEFIANGVDNKLKFEEGVIGMARADYTQQSSSLKQESYNSASADFFIVTKNSPSLNGYYTAFGKVIEGLDIIHKIEEVEVKIADGEEENANTEKSTPTQQIIIKDVKVETFGIDYGLPEFLKPFDYMSWLYKQYGIDPNSFSAQ